MPDEHPSTPPPSRWPALITLPTLAKFQLVWRHLCDVPLPSWLFEYTLTAVCVLPEYRSGRNIRYIRTFCALLNFLYIFDPTCIVSRSGWNSTARMPRRIVSPLVLPDEQPPTPTPRRWPALIPLPTLAKFHLVWRRLCDVVLFPSSRLFEHTLTAVCVLPKY